MKSLKTYLSATLTLALISAVTPANAAYKVYEPDVDKGELELEYKGSRTFDNSSKKDGKQKDKFSVEYGFNDWWGAEIYLIGQQDNDKDSYDLAAFEFANIFMLAPEGKYYVDVGIYAAYEHSIHSEYASELELKLLLSKEYGKWNHVFNLNTSQEVGENSEGTVEVGMAWKTKYKINEYFNPAVEYYASYGEWNDFNEFEDQSHLLGLVIYGEIGEIEYGVGYLAGITRGSYDNVIKWDFGYEF